MIGGNGMGILVALACFVAALLLGIGFCDRNLPRGPRRAATPGCVKRP